MPDGRQHQHNLSPPLAIACLLLLLWLMLIAIAHGSGEQYTWKSILNNIHVMVLLIETSLILIHRVIRHNLVTSRAWPGQGWWKKYWFFIFFPVKITSFSGI